jgi:hypothetical protein
MSQDVTVQHNPEPVRLSIIIRYRQVSSRHREVPARRRAGSSGAGRERPGGSGRGPRPAACGATAMRRRHRPCTASSDGGAMCWPLPRSGAGKPGPVTGAVGPVAAQPGPAVRPRPWPRRRKKRARLSSPGRSIGGSSAVNATIALSKETPGPYSWKYSSTVSSAGWAVAGVDCSMVVSVSRAAGAGRPGPRFR